MCNDAHFNFSGFAGYCKQVLSRLAATKKFELAELSCFGKVNDPKCQDVPWTYYANDVDDKHPDFSMYKSDEMNHYGSWRFERVCLDFKPDIVFDIRDPYMFVFEGISPYRPFYHWAIMPTVDSHPQQDDWIDMFGDADGVLTYSDYGKRVLEKEAKNTVKVYDVASPGVDLTLFKPPGNKKQLKRSLGFSPDINIVGTIMRNQKRKLYPELFKSFRQFLDVCYKEGRKDLADNTFLYAHCSYPDKGWEIPELLLEYEISHKVFFTYLCQRCNKVYCNLFCGPKAACNQCNALSCTLPNTTIGVSSEQLATIFKLFDVYIQYAVCEGFGMPQAEAIACGLPLMTVNYSAMEDFVDKCGAMPIPVKSMFRNTGTNSYRAIPDIDATAKMIFDFISLPVELRNIKGKRSREAAEKYYDWDKTAKIWENYFDQVQLTGLQGQWDAPARNFKPIPTAIPEYLKKGKKSDFVKWIITDVIQDPDKLNGRFFLKMLNDLNFGTIKEKDNFLVFDREAFFYMASKLGQERMFMEQVRTQEIELVDQDYITFARERNKYLNIS